MIKDKFLSIDDFDLGGHHLLDWRHLDDIFHEDAKVGQALVYTKEGVTWSTLSSGEGGGDVEVDWEDITGKPSVYPPSSHTHPWDQVTGKPTFVNSVTAGRGMHVSSSTGTVTISTVMEDDLHEPTGFPNRTDTTMSFDDGTRTFTIEPVGDSFDVYVLGLKYTFTEAQTVAIDAADADGLWYFLFDGDGILTATLTFDADVAAHTALCAIAYWDETNDVALGLGEERHGVEMSGVTHAYLHLTRGTVVESGFGLGDINADASGNLDTSAQLSTANGIMWDEDIRLEITGVSVPAIVPVLYMEGTTGTWRRATPTTFPILPGVSGRAAYNELVGATWQQTDVSNTKFMLMHLIAVNRVETPFYVAIQGQNEYSSKANAQAGALTEIGSIITTGLPMPEFAVVGTIIIQTADSYSNTVQSRIVSTDEGDDYVSWLGASLTAGVGPSDHGSLTGLADADHPLTALQQSSAVTHNGILWNGTTWVANGVVRLDTSALHTDLVEINNPPVTTVVMVESSAGAQNYAQLDNLPISSYVQTALDGKEDTLAVYDLVPTNASTNIVESNGVFDALATKSDTTHTHVYTDVTDWSTANLSVANVYSAGTIRAISYLRAATVYSDNDIYVNFPGPNSDGFVFFYNDGAAGAYLHWDVSVGEFKFNKPIGQAVTGVCTIPAASPGWYKIAEVDSRGGSRFTLSYTGGSWRPVTMIIDVYKDWADGATIKIQHFGQVIYASSARIVNDTSDGKKYLEVYFLTNANGHSFFLYQLNMLGFNTYWNPVVASGTLVSGATGFDLYAAVDVVASGLAVDNLGVQDGSVFSGVARFGSTVLFDQEATFDGTAIFNGTVAGISHTDVGAAATTHTHPLSELEQSAASTNDGIYWNGSTWIPAGVLRIVANAIHTDWTLGSPVATSIVVMESAAGSQRYATFSSFPISTAMQTALDAKEDTLAAYDTVPTNASTNICESNGIFDALATKEDTLPAYDTTPTNGSTNICDSDGIYDALSGKMDVNSITTITAAYTPSNIRTILGDATSGFIFVTLPAASGNAGLDYIFKRLNSGGNSVYVDGNGSETVDGALGVNLGSQYSMVHVVCDGSNWHIISQM